MRGEFAVPCRLRNSIRGTLRFRFSPGAHYLSTYFYRERYLFPHRAQARAFPFGEPCIAVTATEGSASESSKMAQPDQLLNSSLFSRLDSPLDWPFDSPLFLAPWPLARKIIWLKMLERCFDLVDKSYLLDLLNRPRLSNSVRDQTRTLNGLPTRKGLPMVIQGSKIGAQHDTGAERGNFIAHDLACKLKLQIRTGKSDCKTFSMANGKVVRAIGRARALCAFAKEPCSRMKCWFYVFKDLASPLIMGAQFLKTTETMSKHVDRLEDCASLGSTIPKVNLIGSTEQSKRRLAAFIDGRYTHVNADSGSHLDLMSPTYVKMHGYKIDRRTECRKRVRLADNTVAQTIGQTSATITLQDGSSYSKLFDILPQLTSEVLLGETTLEEIGAFTAHENSFVDVFAGERFLELSGLWLLGKVDEFLVHHVRRRLRKTPPQQPRKLPLFLKGNVESVANLDLFSIARETARRRYDRTPTCTRLGS